MRLVRWLTLLLALGLLGGCGRNDGPPPTPGPSVAWSRMWPDKAVRQVKFEHPGNWTIEVDRRHGGSVTLKATDLEWWRLQYHPDQVGADLETFASAIDADRRRRRGNVLTSDRQEATINEHRAIRLNCEFLDDKTSGGRYVLEGGWVIEWEYRPTYQKTVYNALVHATSSLDLTENR